jgi:hypothetical protein
VGWRYFWWGWWLFVVVELGVRGWDWAIRLFGGRGRERVGLKSGN